jgi:NADP-dependent 3-hydroxy acid dehydrogenase YdfG
VLGARRTDRLEAVVTAIWGKGAEAAYRVLDVTKLDFS